MGRFPSIRLRKVIKATPQKSKELTKRGGKKKPNLVNLKQHILVLTANQLKKFKQT